MPDEARRYLLPPHDTFWLWQDGGEVLAWADEKTIGFRAELLHVLRRLAPHGLPPLGAVVLLLAAARDNWRELSIEPGILVGILRMLNLRRIYDDLLVEVLAGLDRVNYLEPELRTPLESKAALAELVFEGLPDRTSPSLAQEVVRALEEGLGEEALIQRGSSRQWNHGPSELLRELRCLSLGLKRVDPEVLALRLRTGLDEIPQPAEVDLPLPERVRALLAELERDEEYCGLARLARHLMAAVTLPRRVSDFEELPVGGVSDISNRGPLERLLLSELAHDDLTLAVRVALNEALYLRREAPPRTPMRHRAVLLDAGIRSWGVPRVFATAVALALAATTDAHTEIVAYRAKGDGIEAVDLTRREPLVAHLEALEPDLHPGAALGAFRAAIGEREAVAEPVLVTTEDVARDAEFQRAIASSELAPLHLATVDRDGRFRLTERSLRGAKLVREARLDLDELFAKPKQPAPRLVDRRQPRDLPAIFAVDPFPLLLSHEFDPCRSWRIDCGHALARSVPTGTRRGGLDSWRVEGGGRVLALTRDRRLMLWTGLDQGAQQVSDTVPGGVLWWFSREPVDGCHRAVVGHFGRPGVHLLGIEPDRLRCGATRLDVDPFYAICSHNGVLAALSGDRAQVISLTSGETIQTLRLPGHVAWIAGRFFKDQAFRGSRWYALSFDGRTARLERVFHDEVENSGMEIVAVFECDGVEGPIGVTAKGNLLSSVTDNLRKVRHGLAGSVQVTEVSPEGRRIVLGPRGGSSSSGTRSIVDVGTLTVDRYSGDGLALTPSFSDVVRPLNLRHRFTHLHVDRRGVLTLTTRKGRGLAIIYDARLNQIRLRGTEGSIHGLSEKRTFKPVSLSRGVGYQLKVAAWDDGSRAFLDSRGLLHLKSSDHSVPETSLVLTDYEMGGWCSDGRLWGPRYHIGPREGADRRLVYESVIGAFAERIA